jgi:Putative prokaryotic signal transducing protein
MSIRGWTVVYEGVRIQADLVAAALEADGLQVEVFGDNAYGVGIDLTAARVMVPDGQASAARRLIKEAEAGAAETEPEDEV